MAAGTVSPAPERPPATDGSDRKRGPIHAVGVDLSALSGNLGFLARIAQQRIFEEFHRRFGADGLTPARYSVLAVLAANRNVRQAAVANALQIKQSNFAVLIAAMEADGLVQRLTDADNRRANMLSLTADGAALHAQVSAEVDAMDREFAQRMTEAGYEATLSALQRFLHP